MINKKVLIIGAGFGGIATALELLRKNPTGLDVTLISDRSHFEFTPSLYRVVVGRSPLEVCIPVSDIIGDYKINFICERIVDVDLDNKKVFTSLDNTYHFDYLVLSIGSETSYYGIKGLEEKAYSFKSISEAIRLKNHIHSLFDKLSPISQQAMQVKDSMLKFVIVGAGPSGVELAGELAGFTTNLAKVHNVDPDLIKIELVEASDRILSSLNPGMVKRIERRLKKLGVEISTNRSISASEINCDTLIWTAGVKPNSLYKKIKGLDLDDRGRVKVDRFLRAENHDDVFVIGDSASTLYAGLAQTAILDGKVVASNIKLSSANQNLVKYRPIKPFYFVPVGSKWSASSLNFITLYGFWGYMLRRAADLRYFLSILPVRKAFRAFFSGKTLCETCNICSI